MCVHSRKEIYCDTCLLESKFEHAAVLDQYACRLDALWELLPQHHELMQKGEQEYPVTALRILAFLPYGDDYISSIDQGQIGHARAAMREAMDKALDEYMSILPKNPNAKLRCSDEGFYVYDFPANVREAWREKLKNDG